ncbi:hypothetical protein CASFOL_020088 [Castilleja foliolosa]|uniref:RNase H type-1 domain-containing protein n=1 Tax=Castilleja foliolosa TaxID=1961234 RepID=A0ABD3CZV2_9LAMI
MNHNGSIVSAFSKKHLCIDSLTAECLAILDACSIASFFLDWNILVESDCLEAVTFINGEALNCSWQSSPVIEKIITFWKFKPKWRFRFIPRLANFAPHELACWAKACTFVGFIPLSKLPISVFCDKGFPLVDNLC